MTTEVTSRTAREVLPALGLGEVRVELPKVPRQSAPLIGRSEALFQAFECRMSGLRVDFRPAGAELCG